MSIKKRRGGYLATAEGVKKLKEAKRVKKYTYQNIAEEARETLDKVKRLFNPQWGDGEYKVGEEAVEAICSVLDLKPEEIVSNWYSSSFSSSNEKELTIKKDDFKIPYQKALKAIKHVAKYGYDVNFAEEQKLDLQYIGLTEIPS